ncbi:hypothetical protein HaLaN_26788 [Haematococcus lacustris]|uniref:Uncharacterized protein n=1 Tax=Haematococcus lacustris TaxID=44745 RepID=A0A6A0A7J5_HAELA|nr:hypothetical protein HaLaN_26788 [Haematococcus lacustris]
MVLAAMSEQKRSVSGIVPSHSPLNSKWFNLPNLPFLTRPTSPPPCLYMLIRVAYIIANASNLSSLQSSAVCSWATLVRVRPCV